MATTTKRNSKDTTTSEETVSRTGEPNQRPIQLVKKAGHAYLDTYEKALQRVLGFEKAAASRSPLPWVTALTNTHTNFVQDVTGPYIKMARAVLK